MLAEARELAHECAAAEGCSVEWEPLFRIDPLAFDPRLIETVTAASEAVTGGHLGLTAGALHDAAEMARRVPAVMVFSSSTGGISHAKEEDTPVEHLELAILTFARAVEAVAGG